MKRATHTATARRNRNVFTAGFTLIEMIIVVGVMAILAGMSAPPIILVLQQRDQKNEEVTLDKIYKAMQAYLNERRVLPDGTITTTTDTNFWANQLAAYTNLSPGQMRIDTWGMPRSYVMYQASQYILGSQVPIFYASVHSMGVDHKASGPAAGTVGIAVNATVTPSTFAAPTDSTWWSNLSGGQAARVDAFSKLASAGDDVMIKFTDYPDKLGAYQTTLTRLHNVGEALDTYSKTAYSQMVAACQSITCNPTAEQMVYFPRSTIPSSTPADTDTLYASTVAGQGKTQGTIDLDNYNGNGNGTTAVNEYIDNSDTDATRRTSMINLMRILGLPDDNCCSALEIIPSSTDPLTGKPQEKPFYYYSNPRPRINGTSCAATRPGVADRKLPARITTVNIPAGGSQVPTCG